MFVPSPVHTLALSAACRRGDEHWLLIVTVFAPLVYPAHAGYLARPDCVDGDTSILSLGGEARRWSVRNEGDVINQRRAHTSKAVSALPETVPRLMEITRQVFFFLSFWNRIAIGSFFSLSLSLLSLWQQRWLYDKIIYIKWSLCIVSLLFILNGCLNLRHTFNQ